MYLFAILLIGTQSAMIGVTEEPPAREEPFIKLTHIDVLGRDTDDTKVLIDTKSDTKWALSLSLDDLGITELHRFYRGDCLPYKKLVYKASPSEFDGDMCQPLLMTSDMHKLQTIKDVGTLEFEDRQRMRYSEDHIQWLYHLVKSRLSDDIMEKLGSEITSELGAGNLNLTPQAVEALQNLQKTDKERFSFTDAEWKRIGRGVTLREFHDWAIRAFASEEFKTERLNEIYTKEEVKTAASGIEKFYVDHLSYALEDKSESERETVFDEFGRKSSEKRKKVKNYTILKMYHDFIREVLRDIESKHGLTLSKDVLNLKSVLPDSTKIQMTTEVIANCPTQALLKELSDESYLKDEERYRAGRRALGA